MRVEISSARIQRENPFPDRGRGFSTQLLIGDRFRKRVERSNGSAWLHVIAERTRDQRSHPRVYSREIIFRCGHARFFSLRKMFCSTAGFRFGEKMATQLTWYGQSGFKLVTSGGKVLSIHPWLTNPLFDKATDELANLKAVDFILLTHGHSDHVGDSVEI